MVLVSAAFHRGITQALRRKLQTAGIRVEEQDAQKLLAGYPVFAPNSPFKEVARQIVAEVHYARFDLMRAWEAEHPGEKPFPPVFAEVVLNTLRNADTDDLTTAVLEVIKLAEAELEL
jgi:hypothetical protein